MAKKENQITPRKRATERLTQVAPEVRALAPLGAVEVAAVFRLDKQTVLDACKLYATSKGREGLRCYHNGKGYKIQPANVVAWMCEMEKSYAENGV